jgi:hypothetical protein
MRRADDLQQRLDALKREADEHEAALRREVCAPC